MNEWIYEHKKKCQLAYLGYGKSIFILTLVFLNVLLLCLIYVLISPKKLELSFLDVGQGDAILVQTPSGKSMLIDGGPSAVVVDKISEKFSYFNKDVDVMVATHPDADHVTGLIPVLEKYNTQIIVNSPVASHTKIFSELEKYMLDENAEMHVAHASDFIDFHDGVTAYILYPDNNFQEKKGDTNDASVSMFIVYGDESFLLTGDLPTTEEYNLLQDALPKNVTVYKAGHHGSKYSSGEQLLSYIKPEYSVISVGKNNKYGHPNQEAIDRLQKYSKEIISTIDRGTITFNTDGRTMELQTTK